MTRAALFDLDGTLVRTFIDFPGMRTALRDLSSRLGTTARTDPEDDILEMVRVMAEARGDAARREAYAILAEIEAAGCAHPEPIDGASDLLADLRRRGVGIGIITRNCRAVSEDLLRRQSLFHDVLVAREDTTEFKPHPEPLRVACRHLGVAPTSTVMTGDLWADIAAGQAAGVRATIGIQWPHDPPNRFARCQPTIEVDSLRAAIPFLLEL